MAVRHRRRADLDGVVVRPPGPIRRRDARHSGRCSCGPSGRCRTVSSATTSSANGSCRCPPGVANLAESTMFWPGTADASALALVTSPRPRRPRPRRQTSSQRQLLLVHLLGLAVTRVRDVPRLIRWSATRRRPNCSRSSSWSCSSCSDLVVLVDFFFIIGRGGAAGSHRTDSPGMNLALIAPRPLVPGCRRRRW